MKKFYFLAAFIIVSNLITAQTFFSTAGGTANDAASCVTITSDNNYIMAGDTYSFGLTEPDILVTKFDGAGNLLWNKRYGSSSADHAYSIIATTDGGCAIAGVTGDATNYILILKLNEKGNLQWSRIYHVNTINSVHSIKQTPDEGFIIGGYIQTANGTQGYILKTDNSGSVEWSKLLFNAAVNSSVQDLALTQDGGYALTASAEASAGNSDIFLIKLDDTGAFKWAKTVGSSGNDVPTSLIETMDAGFALTGFITDAATSEKHIYFLFTDANGNATYSKILNGGTTDSSDAIVEAATGSFIISGSTKSSSGLFDNAFGIKFDVFGNLVWARTIPSNLASSYITHVVRLNASQFISSGSIGVPGSFDFSISRFDTAFRACGIINVPRTAENFGTLTNSTVKISDVTTTAAFTTMDLATDELTHQIFCQILPVYLAWFTATADKNNTVLLQWKTTLEVNSKSIEVYRSTDGRIYSMLQQIAATGSSNGSTYSYEDSKPGTGTNFYKLKFVDKDGSSFFSDVRKVDINKAVLKVFPNPVKDWLNLQMSNVSKSIRIQVFTATGKLVIDKTVLADNNSINTSVDMRRLAAGTYNISIVSENANTKMLFVKQ